MLAQRAGSLYSQRSASPGDAAHPLTWTGGGNDAVADGVSLAAHLADAGLSEEALRAHEASMEARNPLSKTRSSRRGLPSYSPAARVAWWAAWSAFRLPVFVATRAPVPRVLAELAFGAYEMLRW